MKLYVLKEGLQWSRAALFCLALASTAVAQAESEYAAA